MSRYFVNDKSQSNGDHEVHVDGCFYLNLANDVSYLGDYSSCPPAVAEAKKRYPTANGCAFCSRPCHTS